jgi:hypothetical protein
MLYLGGGVGMAIVLFLTNGIGLVFLLIGLPMALLGIALSFFQVNSRPFSYFLESAFNYFRTQRLYLWKQKEGVVYKYDKEIAESLPPTTPLANTVNRKPQKNISSLARKLELQALQKPE